MHKRAARSFVFAEQLQHEWNRRYRADGDQGPADRSPLLTAQLFRKQQGDSSAEHCTGAGNETNLRDGDFMLFHVSFLSLNRNSNPSQMARPQGANRRFEFQKRSQLFIRTQRNVSVAAIPVSNPDFSPDNLRLIDSCSGKIVRCRTLSG